MEHGEQPETLPVEPGDHAGTELLPIFIDAHFYFLKNFLAYVQRKLGDVGVGLPKVVVRRGPSRCGKHQICVMVRRGRQHVQCNINYPFCTLALEGNRATH